MNRKLQKIQFFKLSLKLRMKLRIRFKNVPLITEKCPICSDSESLKKDTFESQVAKLTSELEHEIYEHQMLELKL